MPDLPLAFGAKALRPPRRGKSTQLLYSASPTVVPAQAGTHTPQPIDLVRRSTTETSVAMGPAGTTAMNASTPIALVLLPLPDLPVPLRQCAQPQRVETDEA